MGLDDLMSTESAFVAAATAAIFSPRTRETVRRGAVIGVAGALRAGDVVAGAARGVARGVRSTQPASASNGAGTSGATKRNSSSRSNSSRSRSTASSRSRSNSGRSGSRSRASSSKSTSSS